MAYRYLDDIAGSDVAFEARGATEEEVFASAWEACLALSVKDPDSIELVVEKQIRLEESTMEILLLDFLQEFIYQKDAEGLFLRVRDIAVTSDNGLFCVEARIAGDYIDPGKYELGVDIKAVTLHQFMLKQTRSGYLARVVLDI